MMLWIVLGPIIGIIVLALVGFLLFAERGRLMSRSTIVALREGGLRRALNGQSIHMYIYGRWTNQYIHWLIDRHLPKLDSQRRQKWADHYHGKVITLEQAEGILRLDHDVNYPNAEQIIPYPVARDIIIKNPQAILAYECGCRHRKKNPCQPTQVCMIVGQPFVDFILEHNPKSSRRLTQAEGLELLRAEHERGHVHTAWFKDAAYNRFYAICNCCKCCCGGIEAMVKLGMPMLNSSGYVSEVDQAACSECGNCVGVCPFGAISFNEGPHINRAKCMGCGACVSLCTAKALMLVRAPDKGMPMDVQTL
jgi:ferredoxin